MEWIGMKLVEIEGDEFPLCGKGSSRRKELAMGMVALTEANG